MAYLRKVIKVGNGFGIILPKKLLSHLKASVGDTLVATHTAGGIELTLEGANFDHQRAAAREVIPKRKQALGKLK